ncbi:glycosyltransferase family 34 protein [Sodiomyces alcalophilus JCM 7366]|uniref:glycosyltransferase family 34 protein n=1 Tax=Sodiomyces alcalophilus JCM 7366 TaxID=591952 RepID=UPI0039B5E7C0
MAGQLAEGETSLRTLVTNHPVADGALYGQPIWACLAHYHSRMDTFVPSSLLSDTGIDVDAAARGSPRHLGPQGSPLPTLPVTPFGQMPLSRSPSPLPGGGWPSHGLDSPDHFKNDDRHSPASRWTPSSNSPSFVPWESAAMRKPGGRSYPSFSTTQSRSFFQKYMHRISSSLPRFNHDRHTRYADKDKLGRGTWSPRRLPMVGRICTGWSRRSRGTRLFLLFIFFILASRYIFYNTSLVYKWRRSASWGGGEKFVIILGANVEGGVMEWKGGREWAIERDSIRNKKRYVARWGYDLEIVDMSTKKRYAHEWRQGWEKVDLIRKTLRKYPKAEWVWWLDLNTLIMEPSYSLQSHIFDNLAEVVYRDVNEYNPLNFTHPFTEKYLDSESRSPVGDGKEESVSLLLTQDCMGFNLGSFFVRRSAWLDRLLDMWWDPVAYEQMHMQWSRKEQDPLEQLYSSQPWVRKHTAFLPQRMINSFPPGACGEGDNDARFHYQREDRDFVVHTAGCEVNRDCWGEIYNYRELSYYLNRSLWERFKEDLVAVIWYKLTGQKVKL